MVIGLQSTGESSTDAALKLKAAAAAAAGADEGAETTSTDYISAPQQTLQRVIDRCFALPPLPRAMRKESAEEVGAGERSRKMLHVMGCTTEMNVHS